MQCSAREEHTTICRVCRVSQMKKSNVTRKLKARWNLPQMLKYEWSINASTSEEWLLTDTDTVFQCTPSELKARFRAFGAPVVIGDARKGPTCVEQRMGLSSHTSDLTPQTHGCGASRSRSSYPR